MVRYIHLNPLRAKIVRDLEALDEYKHAGHSAIMGKIDRPWQDINEVLGRFSDKRRQAVRSYREFVAGGVKQGRRPELAGGGLLRSSGGWTGVLELRKGREKYRSDERVLGSSSFIEDILNEYEKDEKRKSKQIKLDTLITRITKDMNVKKDSLAGGGRNRLIAKTRGVLAYVWLRHLGRSGYQLASALGVSSQSLYAASNRIESGEVIKLEDVERWCE